MGKIYALFKLPSDKQLVAGDSELNQVVDLFIQL